MRNEFIGASGFALLIIRKNRDFEGEKVGIPIRYDSDLHASIPK